MYAVIFTATLAAPDDEYHRVAAQLRALAFSRYGCKGFESFTEGIREVTISYWDKKEHIRAWKNDPQHHLAQQKGSKKWYQSYRVEICELCTAYEYKRT